MKQAGNFVWTDLSTYDLEEAKSFYDASFHWNSFRYGDVDEETYLVAFQGNQAVAGMYLLPKFLQKKRFPSFWMSYIQVECLENIIETALTFEGTKIEIGPTAFEENSRISLIRDPLGAGFTMYEGVSPDGRYQEGHGKFVWNKLHISDVTRVKSFYEALFDWQILETDVADKYHIKSSGGVSIGEIEILPNQLRGGYEYWMPVFEVRDFDSYFEILKRLGGQRIFTFEDRTTMVCDSLGASFLIREAAANQQ